MSAGRDAEYTEYGSPRLARRVSLRQKVAQSAQVLGCSPGTVKSQTAKALNALRDIP